MSHQWAIKTSLLPDELFSSWLVRCALEQGCDPLVLTWNVWGKWRVFTIDIDRIYDKDLIKPFTDITGTHIEHVRQASLYPMARRIVGVTPPEKAIWSWILALGARGTKRNRGLQFCPACFAEDKIPYYRKQWRYAWHTICEKHQMVLLDHCDTCNAAIEPHRLIAEDRCVSVCASCKANLSCANAPSINNESLLFQSMADKVLESGVGEFQLQHVSPPDWFAIAEFFFKMLKRANRTKSTSLQSFLNHITNIEPYMFSIEYGSSVELLCTHERHQLLAHVYRLTVSTNERMTYAAEQSGITRQGFCERGQSVPKVLLSLYESLPDNPIRRTSSVNRKSHVSRPRHEVMSMMAKLERKLAMAKR